MWGSGHSTQVQRRRRGADEPVALVGRARPPCASRRSSREVLSDLPSDPTTAPNGLDRIHDRGKICVTHGLEGRIPCLRVADGNSLVVSIREWSGAVGLEHSKLAVNHISLCKEDSVLRTTVCHVPVVAEPGQEHRDLLPLRSVRNNGEARIGIVTIVAQGPLDALVAVGRELGLPLWHELPQDAGPGGSAPWSLRRAPICHVL